MSSQKTGVTVNYSDETSTHVWNHKEAICCPLCQVLIDMAQLNVSVADRAE